MKLAILTANIKKLTGQSVAQSGKSWSLPKILFDYHMMSCLGVIKGHVLKSINH